jgi:regulator of replication initiation timing
MIQSKENISENEITYHTEIKQHIEQLIHDIAGLPEEARYVMNEIINKVIHQDISTKTAVVAIHEIYKEFNGLNKVKSKKTSSSRNESKEQNYNMKKLYKNGYR